MTIILSTKRDDFAVLVADQLIGSQTGPPVYARKVHLHPTLPLAFAVGGCMWLPVGNHHAPALEHVAQFAAGIVREDQLVVVDLADRLRQFLQPGMDHMSNTIQVFIALVKNGIADVGLQQVTGAEVVGTATKFVSFRQACMNRPGRFATLAVLVGEDRDACEQGWRFAEGFAAGAQPVSALGVSTAGHAAVFPTRFGHWPSDW